MEKFPLRTKRIIDDVKNADVVIDIPVGTASNLISFAEQAGVEFDSNSFVLKLYKIFGR